MMTVISYTLILTFLSFLNSHIDLIHMGLLCTLGASFFHRPSAASILVDPGRRDLRYIVACTPRC